MTERQSPFSFRYWLLYWAWHFVHHPRKTWPVFWKWVAE